MEHASVSAISLRHILASPWYAPWTIAVWMERGFNACQMHRSMYPSIFHCFPVIQPVSSKVRHFSTFFAHFGLPEYAPGTIAVNFTWIERGFNACKTLRTINPSIFSRFWDIARYCWEIATFSYPFHLTTRYVNVTDRQTHRQTRLDSNCGPSTSVGRQKPQNSQIQGLHAANGT